MPFVQEPAPAVETIPVTPAPVTQATEPAATEPAITVTKSETVTTPLAPKAPNDAIWLFTWLPLIVMMGLWLYLRGRNQAAARARADALMAASSKKLKKPSRPQSADADDASSSSGTASNERSKGNSKKNKKDKLQQKKKQQQTSSGAPSSKAKPVSAPAISAAASSSAPVVATTQPPTDSAQPISASTTSTSTVTASAAAPSSTIASSAERKATAPAAQPAKAIFEPLRKVPASAPQDVATDEAEGDEESDFVPQRKRRPSPPPIVVTTPTKVSGGRFEKLNVPPANAGLNASSANRWPAEAARPATPVRAPQPNMAPQAITTSTVETGKSAAPAPITGRGLGAFVKLAKPSNAETSATESSEAQTESSRM
jgi:hypothetical protein